MSDALGVGVLNKIFTSEYAGACGMLFLEVAGFRLLQLGAFPGFDCDVDETT